MRSRRGRAVRGSVVGVVFGVAALLAVGGAGAQAAAEPNRGAASQLLVLINGDRAAAGLAPLGLSSVAIEVAETWSGYMADTGELAHNDAWFGADARERAGAGAVGENVAFNADIADAHRRLMNSEGHRANILDGRFHQVGIGVVQGTSGAYWITEDFLQLKDTPAVVAEPAPAPADPSNPPPPPAPPTPATPPPGPATRPTGPATLPTGPATPPPSPATAPPALTTPPPDTILAVAQVAESGPAELAAGSRSPLPARDRGVSARLSLAVVAGPAFFLLLVITRRLSHLLRR